MKIVCVWANGSSGTGTLIKGPGGTNVLFDIGGGAVWASYCKTAMDANSVSSIQYTIAGHYDSDHIGGLDDLVNLTGGNSATGYSPNVGTVKFYDRGGSKRQDNTAIPSDYLDFVNASARRGTITTSTDLSLGTGATLKILSAGAADTTSVLYVRGKSNVTVNSENDLSVTALLTYGGFDMYLGSDAEGVNEKAVDDVIATSLGRKVDVLHVDHHGSDTYNITSPEFLGIMDPEVAIISCWNNSFGHPRVATVTNLQAVVEPLSQRIIRLSPGDTDEPNFAPENMSYCATTNGHVTITTNGSTYTVSGNGLTQTGLTNHATDDDGGDQPTPTPAPSAAIKVNQVCPFSSPGEYVELYNPGTSSVTLAGYVLDVYSGDYTFTSSDVIPAKGYYLVSDTNPVAGRTPDRVAAINITDNGASSYAQLKNASGVVVDKVGWSTSTIYEGTKLGTLATGMAWARKTDGVDTNNNVNDFSAITPNPRNSSLSPVPPTNTPGVAPTNTPIPTPTKTPVPTNTPTPAPVTALNESFEGTYPPSGWTQAGTVKVTTYKFTGSYSAQINANGDYLITPMLGASDTLTFWYYPTSGKLNVEYGPSVAGPWTAVAGSPFTKTAAAWSQISVGLSAYPNSYIRFMRVPSLGYHYLDDVVTTQGSTPPAPTNTPVVAPTNTPVVAPTKTPRPPKK